MRWVRDRLSRKGEGEREKVVYLLCLQKRDRTLCHYWAYGLERGVAMQYLPHPQQKHITKT